MTDTICQAAGIIMIVGALFLLFKEKIYLDSQTSQPTSVEVPFFGKLRTNAPALVIFALGVVAVAYPLHFDHLNYLKVTGTVKSNAHPVVVYVVSSQSTVGNESDLEISLPQLPSKDYNPYVILVAGNTVDYRHIALSSAKNGVISIGDINILDNNTTPVLKSIQASTPEGFAK